MKNKALRFPVRIMQKKLATRGGFCIFHTSADALQHQPTKTMTNNENGVSMIEESINRKLGQWSREAGISFATRGAAGEKMHREIWANGQTMVGWEGARANQMIPLHAAIEIFRAGWKVIA